MRKMIFIEAPLALKCQQIDQEFGGGAKNCKPISQKGSPRLTRTLCVCLLRELLNRVGAAQSALETFGQNPLRCPHKDRRNRVLEAQLALNRQKNDQKSEGVRTSPSSGQIFFRGSEIGRPISQNARLRLIRIFFVALGKTI